jgi:hypothetical protein
VVTRNREQNVPNFASWSLARLIAEAKRLGVPSLKRILKEQDQSMAKHELVDILTEAYS